MTALLCKMSKYQIGIKASLGSKCSIAVLDLLKQSSKHCLRQSSLTNGSQQLSGVQNVVKSTLSVLMNGPMHVNVDIQKTEMYMLLRTC